MPLSVSDFLAKAKYMPVLDVRSPSEYGHARIPSAHGFPLFDDNERAQIGTVYKQKGKDKAVLLGLEMVGPKLADFVRRARKIAPQNELLVHCWRGGMRSGSMAWLLKTAGLNVDTLAGGYKAYRSHVLASFSEQQKIVVLGGKTGSGKTEILQELSRLGEQVIDLEGIAHHKGSSYGAIGQLPQPSSEQFENLLYEQWATIDRTRTLWLEDESRNVGKCSIPIPLWHQMREQSITIFVDIPKAERIERLVRDYTGISHELLQEATQRIEKRLGGLQHKAALAALTQNDYATVADITLGYYDKAYMHGLSQKPPANVVKIAVEGQSPAQIAQLLVHKAGQQ